jgi:hypothetical protein
VYVETRNNLYKFTFSDVGTTFSSSHRLLLDDQPCTIIGSITDNDELFHDMIVRGASLIIDLKTKRIKIGPIVSASIYTEEWHYDLWS